MKTIFWRLIKTMFWGSLTILGISLLATILTILVHFFPTLMFIVAIVLIFVFVYSELKANDEFKEWREHR